MKDFDDYEGFEPDNGLEENSYSLGGYNPNSNIENTNSLGGYNPNSNIENTNSSYEPQTLGGYNPNGYEQPQLNNLSYQESYENGLGGYNPNSGLDNNIGGYNPNNTGYSNTHKDNDKDSRKIDKKQKKLEKKQKRIEDKRKKKEERQQKRLGKKQIKIPFIVWVLLIIGIYIGCNKYAEVRFTEVASDYPFYFENSTNSLGYVTDNFKVNKNYGDKVKTTWKSNSKLIEIHDDGTVVVTRPINKSQEIIIKETHRFLLGTYSREFKINIIKSKILNINNIDVITREQLASGNYNRDMKVDTDKNGYITSMFGDFKNTKIQSYEDGIVLIDAYRNELGINNNISFESLDIICYKDYTNYIYRGVYDGVSVDNQIITLVVDNSNYSLVKIAAEFDREVPNTSLNNKDIDVENIISKKEDTNEFVVLSQEKILTNINNESLLVVKVAVTFKDGRTLEYIIDINSEKVLNTKELDRTVTVEGTSTEERTGSTISFNVEESDAWFNSKNYYLTDVSRNIHTTDDNGYYNLINFISDKYEAEDKEDLNLFELIGYLAGGIYTKGANAVNDLLQFDIKSNSTLFEDSIAATSYYNTQIVYDWYKENLGIVSYDNKGGAIFLKVHSNNRKDNASFNWQTGVLTVCNTKDNKYTYGSDINVIGHEFTHGVFGTNLEYLESEDNYCIGAINEAYADIFGMLINENSSWIIGKNYDVNSSNDTFIRDINNMTTHNGKKVVQLSTSWDDKDFNKECHAASVIISNVACNMEKSENFDWHDIRDIWFTALELGYSTNSTFLDCRRNVINAMEELNYSKELMDEVGKYFDNVAIYDEAYAYETESSAVDGDFMLDDTVYKKYYIVRLPLFEIFGFDKSFLIGEETDKISDSVVAERKDKIQQAFNAKKDTMHDILGNPLQVDYFQIPLGTADKLPGLIDAITNETANRLGDILTDAQDLSLSQEEVDEIEGVYRNIMDWFFQITVFEGTSYDLYDNLGLID